MFVSTRVWGGTWAGPRGGFNHWNAWTAPLRAVRTVRVMKVPVMHAVRWDGAGVRLDEVRRARPATGQVLVRVGAVVLDRRDAEPLAGPRPTQLDAAGVRTLGRHVAGTVAMPGAGADGWPLGRPVALQPEVTMRRGWFAPGTEHDGGLAEYVVAPTEGLVLLPRDLPMTIGALLPLAARAHGMLARAGVVPGTSVGIWGAGSLGGAALAVARLLGAAPIAVVDPDPAARAAALEGGADAALDPADPTRDEQLIALTAGRGLAAALHTAPDAAAGEQAFTALAPDGRGVLAGPMHALDSIERWDGRALSGPPRVDPDSLPRLAHLASHGRLHLPVPRELSGGLPAAAELLAGACRGASAVTPHVVLP